MGSRCGWAERAWLPPALPTHRGAWGSHLPRICALTRPRPQRSFHHSHCLPPSRALTEICEIDVQSPFKPLQMLTRIFIIVVKASLAADEIWSQRGQREYTSKHIEHLRPRVCV